VLYGYGSEEALALNVPGLLVGGEAMALSTRHALKDATTVRFALPSYFYL
jgi:hypothetical protein